MGRLANQEMNYLAVTSFKNSLKVRIHILEACSAPQSEVVKYMRKISEGKTSNINAVVCMREFEGVPLNPASTGLQFITCMAGANREWVCSLYKVTSEVLDMVMNDDFASSAPPQDSSQMQSNIEPNRI